MSYDQLNERYKAPVLFYANTFRFIYIATCIQCGLDTLLNLQFKSSVDLFDLQVHSEHKQTVFSVCHV
jgi:hypothetical protein